jgi:hypothetical protein
VSAFARSLSNSFRLPNRTTRASRNDAVGPIRVVMATVSGPKNSGVGTPSDQPLVTPRVEPRRAGPPTEPTTVTGTYIECVRRKVRTPRLTAFRSE